MENQLRPFFPKPYWENSQERNQVIADFIKIIPILATIPNFPSRLLNIHYLLKKNDFNGSINEINSFIFEIKQSNNSFIKHIGIFNNKTLEEEQKITFLKEMILYIQDLKKEQD